MDHNVPKKTILIPFFLVILTLGTISIISFTQSIYNHADHKNYAQIISMDIDNVDQLAKIFPKTVTEINNWATSAIILAQEEVATILAVEHPTFANTIRAIDISSNKLSSFISIVAMLQNVHPDKEIRDTLTKAVQTLLDASIDIYMSPQLYNLVQNYSENKQNNETLSVADELLLTNYLKTGKKSGLHLPQDLFERVKKITKEITLLEQEFNLNINNDTSSIKATKTELTGVSDTFIQGLEKDDELYIIPCNMSCYMPIMTDCSIQETRKKMFLAMKNKAYPQNNTVLKNLLTKRHELATLLGYEHFANLDLSLTSAQHADTVNKFLLDLIKIAREKALQEFALLQKKLPSGVQISSDGSFKEWDYPYIFNQYKKKYFSIDETTISEYFPVQKVIDGVFKIYQEFLGLTFKLVTPKWTWHEDVKLIEVYRCNSSELLGYLFLDLYPRSNKYSHACMHPQIISYHIGHKHNTSVATVITNFPKPSGDTPALLKYNDVVTFFHEFGHAMHHLLARTIHPGQAGTSVAFDFIETPSQMFEEWMFEPEMLALVSQHYKTNDPLPTEIIEKKIALRKANSGYWTLRQSVYALFSLHSMTNESCDPSSLWKALHQNYYYSLIEFEEQDHDYAAFGHLASNLYASKYYTYLWTKVFALDLFNTIKEHSFDSECSQKVINLLSAGGSIESEMLLEQFLGRKPNQAAFLKILGLQ